jgi:hypothetical protein
MDKYQFKVSTINAVLDYLSKRPYVEVHQLISAIQEDAENFEKSQKESDGLPGSN